MMKSVITAGAAALLLGSLMSTAFADDTGGGKEMDRQDAATNCSILMNQFDALKTTNTKAIELRKKAGNLCADSEWRARTDRGIRNMQQALRMVGVKPKVL